ncbi:hypothetical protein SEMRO_1707_G292580.1 [Seminavis robusta]|uniref:Uncharacterized protein n=1 Tax=Seminavis robusta TaxID=568900 RepID=A0A9N8HU80_9STRA|nr:hypothetical protein SEMRO_1707_G292580.1 [Seminavis robusta]|eukprot:Sro1707_g292580.1 n/a (291) ;mRNA; f:4327-5343
MAEELMHCSPAKLVVYPPKDSVDGDENKYKSGKKLEEVIQELKKKTPPTSDDHPLIVVAPTRPQKPANDSGFLAEQISALAAFAQEELDIRTKHKPMSEASAPFAISILAGNGIRTATEEPIREAGSLADPPKFSWEVLDLGGRVWNKSEHAGTLEVVEWFNQHLLAGEKGEEKYGLKVVTGAVLPKVKGNRKSAAGKGDIAIGKLENMEHGETFTFVNGLVELKTDRSRIKTGKNLLELFALSMTSKIETGVALLATNCDKTWQTFHFSEAGVLHTGFMIMAEKRGKIS